MTKKAIRFYRVQTKLSLVIVLIVIISLVLSGYISYRFSSQEITNLTLNNLLNSVSAVNQEITLYLDNTASKLSYFAKSDYNLLSAGTSQEDNSDKVNSILINLKNMTPNASLVYYGTADKKIYTFPHVDLNPDFDPSSRPWYKGAVEAKGNPFWTDAYKDEVTGNYAISVSQAVINPLTNEAVGVVGMDLNLYGIENLLKNVKIGQKGMIFLVDKNGIVFVDSSKKLMGADLSKQAIGQQIMKSKEGNLKSKFEGADSVIIFDTNPITGWKIVGVVNKSDYLSAVSKINRSFVAIIIVFSVVALLAAYLFAKSFTRPIYEVMGAMSKLREGDLTSSVNVKRSDEFGILEQEYNETVSKLKAIAKRVKESSSYLIEASKNFKEISDNTVSAVEDVAKAVEDIAKGANDQAQEISASVQKVSEFGQDIDKVLKTTQEVRLYSEKADDVKAKGLEKLEALRESSEEMNKAAIYVFETVRKIKESSREITAITSVIEEIADKTNLLSLNAAIEAARAGEAGRGFAVVAEEVKKLAQQSAESTSRIKEIIEEMHSAINLAVEAMQNADQSIVRQNEAVKGTQTAFAEFEDFINNVTKRIDEINSLMNLMQEKKDEIVASMENISAISEETAAATEEVSASTEEQLSAVEDLKSAAKNLEEVALELEEAVKVFRI
ncbi:methyl-accepting chemotaxis protein [Caldanaerobacter subterraneus]|uniref:Methyl-accepting chemotaxis protein n=1 Tax=Caldanaerobacter subterraneus TaxID=911092 RepID=A0A7Y2PLN4_9THEO|nr:methyl-accepting chemotaxis protein [Caldanaerobacter subterraneus]NNG65786.1 methyl-accepting chemotaxis protein [Caldanaerobacter subterraneus]